MHRMKIKKNLPIGTHVLVALIIVSYLALSSGTPYMTNEGMKSLSFSAERPESAITHLFAHVGLQHLIGNLIPLLLFGILLETALGVLDVLLVFFLSGIISAFAFSFFNPATVLIGASAGISGLMSASLFLKPKKALVFLILLPIAIYLVVFPALDYASTAYSSQLVSEKATISQNVGVLNESLQVAIARNDTQKAGEIRREIATNVQVLKTVENKEMITNEGTKREKIIPTDVPVHFYGGLAGALYLFLFRRKKLDEGQDEFAEIGEKIYNIIGKVKKAIRAWK